MARTSGFPPPFKLGPWLVQAELNRVSGPDGTRPTDGPDPGDVTHQVEPRIMRVLLMLVEHAGAVVTRQELLDEVWADTVVGEEILTRAVSELRRIFRDDARRPAYIETIRQHGYRLVMPVVPAAYAAAAAEPAVVAEPVVAAPPPVPEPPPPQSAPAEPRDAAAAMTPRAPDPRVDATRPSRHLRRLLPLLAVATAAVLVLTASPWRRGGGDRPPAAVEPAPLTSYPGRELHPALSPDGLRVAFAWNGPDGQSPGIYIKQRNSETALRVTGEPGWPAWPAWLPDGQSVVFVQTADTASAICLVASLGGPVRRLRRVPSLVEGLTVAADGERLAWSAREPGGGPFRVQGLSLADPSAPWQPAPAVGPAGDVQPRFSPDGRRLAWVALGPGGSGVLHMVRLDGGQPELVVAAHGPVGGLAWSADSRRLIYAAAPAGTYALWSVAADGGRPEALPLPAGFALNPSIAAGTGDLAWEQVSLDQDIWGLRVTARDPWRLETAPFLVSTRWESDADLDPVDGRVVFVSLRSGRPQLWVAAPDGSNPEPLADVDGAALSHPRWSPDGARIAFRAVTGEGVVVLVVPAAGGRARPVPLPADDVLPTGWTRDGRALLVAADFGDGWQIHRVDPVDGSRQALTHQGGLTAAESADGRDLLHTRPGVPGLWRQRLGSTDDPEIVVAGLPAGDRTSWRLTGRTIHWVWRTRGAAILMRCDSDGGSSEPLAELPGWAPGSLAVAADGNLVLFAHAGEAVGDLMSLPAAGLPEN